MRRAGFDSPRILGLTDFWTSDRTRGVDFCAVKPRRSRPLLTALAALAALAAIALLRRR